MTRYNTGKPSFTCLSYDYSPTPQEAGNLTWRVSGDPSGIEVEDILNLVRLGLKVEQLYRNVGFLFLDRCMPEVKPRLIDLITSHGQMWVSPDYQAVVKNGCDRMRLLFDV